MVQNKRKILIIEDEDLVRNHCVVLLKDLGFEVEACDRVMKAIGMLQKSNYDVILSDLVMPEHDGLSLLKMLKDMSIDIPVIIMTAYAAVPTAITALKSGAFHYIAKPFSTDELVLSINSAIQHAQMSKEIIELRKELKDKYSCENMVGNSPAMQNLLKMIEVVAPTDHTVLILGETGTGKEMVARAIHYNSNRNNHRFIKINCSALTETLMESEIFGHEKGSFTGAVSRKHGLFEVAHGGTIFLDEIGDMPLGLQAKLLQVIEHGVFRRVGGVEEVNVDVRVIAATNRNLEKESQNGTFRADLYYRLNVVTLKVSPLRERKDDIQILVKHFLNKQKTHTNMVYTINKEAMFCLLQYDWPGNVRELQNVVEQACMIANDGVITIDALPHVVKDGASQIVENTNKASEHVLSLSDVERQHIQHVLTVAKNKTQAAEMLGITMATLRSKIKLYGLASPSDID